MVDGITVQELNQEEDEAAEKCWAQEHPDQPCPYTHRNAARRVAYTVRDGFDLLKTFAECGFAASAEAAQAVKLRKRSMLNSDVCDLLRWPNLHEKKVHRCS
jgi:hypothetical protein